MCFAELMLSTTLKMLKVFFVIGVEDGGSGDVVSDRGGSDDIQDDLDDGSGTFLVTCC